MNALPARPRVVLLNPPGRRVYLRDYYCSKVSQADYVNHPIDLLYLSGTLKDHAELEAVDAIVERLSPRECLERVARLRPDAVIGLIGSASCGEDVPFYESLKSSVAAQLLLSGDILTEERERRLRRWAFADAFLHDFSSPDARTFLQAGPRAEGLRNMTVRDGDDIRALPIVRQRGGALNLPVPLHRLFLGKNYRYPFVRGRRFATVMTEFGCPYRCNFCVMSTLGWTQRPLENVLEEFDQLQGLGVGQLLFLDQTFGISRERTLQLLEAMRVRGYGFGWVCFSRPDTIDDRLLRAMRKAGCHTVILGVESGSEEILRAAWKDYRCRDVRRGFEAASRQGLRTVATVILGLPEETEATFQRTLEFLRSLRPDFVSFNVAVPRMGTPLRRKALDLGLIPPDLEIMDQSGTTAAMPTLTLSRNQVEALRRQAVGEFYFNLRYLARRLAKTAATPADLAGQLRQGLSLLRNRLA